MSLPVYAQSQCETPGHIPLPDHGKWGYLSEDGIVIAAGFDFAGPFTADGAVACDPTQCGLIDTSGKFISPTWLPNRRLFPQQDTEWLSPAIEDGKGLCGSQQTRYTCVTTWLKGKHGVIDHEGNYGWRDAEEQNAARCLSLSEIPARSCC